MRIWFLSSIETFIVDVIAWIILHLGIGFLCSQIKLKRFNPNKKFYQSFGWEQNGDIYEKIFHVRTWKKLIPQGSKLYPNGFSLQHLAEMDPVYLENWLRESIRAEFCHWVMMIPGIFFFLWNSVIGGIGMVVYAIIVNIIPIIMQRFNRPRIRRLLKQIELRQQMQQKAEFVMNPVGC